MTVNKRQDGEKRGGSVLGQRETAENAPQKFGLVLSLYQLIISNHFFLCANLVIFCYIIVHFTIFIIIDSERS